MAQAQAEMTYLGSRSAGWHVFEHADDAERNGHAPMWKDAGLEWSNGAEVATPPPRSGDISANGCAIPDGRQGVDRISTIRMFLATSAFIGTQIAWGLQMDIATPTFRELGVSQSLISLIWLGGPVSGIIMQPLIGECSDRCTSPVGRRRPFILGALLALIPTTLVFGHARTLGKLLGDGQEDSDHKVAATLIAGCSFWVMDFAINAIMGPVRALTSDMFSIDQQAQASGILAMQSGIGYVAAFGIGSLNLVKLSSGLFSSQLQGLSIIACLLISLFTACTLCFAKEISTSSCVPQDKGEVLAELPKEEATALGLQRSNNRRACSVVEKYQAFPPILRIVFVVQFFTSIGKFALNFVTDWFGEIVFEGNPQAAEGSLEFKAFQQGIRTGSAAMMVCGITSGLFGLVLPLLLRIGAKRYVWMLSLGVGILALFAMTIRKMPVAIAIFLTACLGVSLGARESIPWSIVTAVSKGGNAGANTAVFNLSQSVPALLGSALGSVILLYASLSSLFLVCALCITAAVAIILFWIPADLKASEEAHTREGKVANSQTVDAAKNRGEQAELPNYIGRRQHKEYSRVESL